MLDAAFALSLHSKPAKTGDVWPLNEVCIVINGRPHGLWRAVDQDGYIFDETLQAHRNTKLAKRLLTRLLKQQGICPMERRSYSPSLKRW
ncbi:IS6 family transposase [Acetobacter vaccinii]|uniref:IS6 family transposase n=1 Tax=Acetobacter vaccinii TaxID=2592655 RepID=A0A5C1YTV0_9PROT|nr:IS6 family transposase [Acetobacter vaccinii]